MTCSTGAVNPVLRAEGVAEPLGDILINCTGGTPGTVLAFNLAIFLNIAVTNRVSATGFTDVLLTIDTGSGPVPSMVAGLLQTSNSVSFNGVSVTIPPSGIIALRVTNFRGNVSQLGASQQRPVVATLSINGVPSSISYNTNPVIVGLPATGLLGILSDTGIRCTGSPLPSIISFSGLLNAGTRFVSTRVTEGFFTAFEKKSGSADSGVRIVARYKGLPTGARLFIPDVIAGSDAVHPTIAGDLGGTVSGGSYTPGGGGSLLLVRVLNTDSNGAGGALAYVPGAPGSGTVEFNAASEITLNNGAGIAVYEVVDSNPSVRESAQFPTFLGLAPIADGSGPIATEEISFGPISTVGTATATDPIPRFVPIPPASDCPVLGDCNATYFPALSVSAARPLEYTESQGAAPHTLTVMIQNQGGGVLSWTATLSNVTGSGWVTVSPAAGVNGGTVLVTVHPESAPAGVYTGTLTIDAGPLAGSRTLPIKATIVNGPVFPIPGFPAPPLVTVRSLTSAARPDSSAVAPGSLANVNGSHFGGKDAAVTFDGTPATIVSRADDFITLLVPESISAPKTAQLQVTVDGDKSLPLAVAISEQAPAIFPNGVLNEDYSANTASNPAPVGGTLLILATGLKNGGLAPVQVRLHDRTLTPSAAGPAPGLVGISLVSAVIPADLPAMTTYMFLCGSANPDQPVCSQVAFVTLK